MHSASSRILSLENCITLRNQLRETKQRVVLTNGCFDILHRGHFEYLQQSASLGDFLIVAINSDESVRVLKGPDRPLNSQYDRAYAIASLRGVDAVFIFPGPRLANEIRALAPDIYTKAGDYTIETLDPDERQALKDVKADIRFLPFIPGHSTTNLLQKVTGRKEVSGVR
jgi:D-glycero-beta-D-manno-heptose 1-phosphate adenylyltransferase